MPTHVTVRLKGGLGNILFQIATCIGTALKFNLPYFIPRHTLNDSVWKPYIIGDVHYESELGRTLVARIHYEEPKHSYTEIDEPFGKVFELEGYFQSYLYFENYRKDILRIFKFDNLITRKGVCSIHVRRGDYLSYPSKHPVVTSKYLILAIEEIEKRTGSKKYLVFSDDMGWCKNFFKNISAYSGDEKIGDIEFEFSENNNELTDLKLMAECEHNIIANSTFSWWGAWLNNNPDKAVITPHEDNWFGIDNKHLDVSTLLPKDWIRIKY